MNDLADLQATLRDARIAHIRVQARKGMAPWPHVMIVWGPGFKTRAHHHHCLQLLMSLNGSLLVRTAGEKPWKKCGAAWVRSDAAHEMDARGTTLLIGFINVQSDVGAALSERIDGDIAFVPDREVARWRAELGPTPNETRVERWVIRNLHRERRQVAIHPAVRRVLSYLHEPQSMPDDLSLKKLASIATLSPGRFMHAFTESVGVPVRPYILWLRLQRAACDLTAGASVTSAAHRAGFSDAAHLTRTFRRHLGATPSELALLKRVTLGFFTRSQRGFSPRCARDRCRRLNHRRRGFCKAPPMPLTAVLHIPRVLA